jgi:hypothetical protein
MRCEAGRGQAGRAGKKGGLGSAIATEVEAEVERLIGAGVVEDFQAIETEARRVALQIMGQAVAGKLNADHSDARGSHLCYACGGEARFAGRLRRRKTTLAALVQNRPVNRRRTARAPKMLDQRRHAAVRRQRPKTNLVIQLIVQT